MEKPDSEVLDDLISTVHELRDLKSRTTAHKEVVKSAARQLECISDGPTLLAAVQYAYWMLPEVAVDVMSFALIGRRRNAKFMKLMGAVTVDFTCDVCAEILTVTSRSQIKAVIDRSRDVRPRFAEGYRHVCMQCEKRIFADRHKKYEMQKRERQTIIAKLRSLPFADYLRTEDWQKRAREQYKYLQWAIGSEGTLTCQLCPNESGLRLRHKAIESVGNEYSHDLLLLCSDCAELMSRSGRIISETNQ